MLSKELNDTFTRVGPGTSMGKLLRNYWFPVAAKVELDEEPVKKVRLLSEDLVLYRDRSGTLGLIDEPCPHRRVSLEYGIPEQEGLRCPYHGWVFNQDGKCLEQSAEPWDSTFKDRVTTKAYPVQEMGGLVFAYLGPQPAPLLPRYDLFVWDNVIRQVGDTLVPCNFIQAMENSLDPVHVEWLHGYYFNYVLERRGMPGNVPLFRKHMRIGFDRFEHGMIKRRILAGEDEECDDWRIGHPVVFPFILKQGTGGAYTFQIRVPVDDTHTWHLLYTVYRPGFQLPPQESVPFYEIPLKDEDNKFITDFVLAQDMFAWSTQGAIAQRDKEHLGQSDVGVLMYRELPKEQLDRSDRDEPLLEIYRDPAQNQCIMLPQEELGYNGARFQPRQRTLGRQVNGPEWDNVVTLFHEAEARSDRGESLLPPIEPPAYPVGVELHRDLPLQP